MILSENTRFILGKGLRAIQDNLSPFQAKALVREGCLFSSLFNIHTEFMTREVPFDWNNEITIEQKEINVLQYADDTIIIAGFKERNIISFIVKLKQRWKAALSRSKTKGTKVVEAIDNRSNRIEKYEVIIIMLIQFQFNEIIQSKKK